MIKCINELVVAGSLVKLICRDGNCQWADSLGLPFTTYYSLSDYCINNEVKVVIFDIAVGWTTTDDMEVINKFISSHSNIKYYIKLVDQFSHQKSGYEKLGVMDLISRYDIKVIGLYDVDYYGLDVLCYLPYPYLDTEEVNRSMSIRENKALLSGADIPEIYPLRCKLYNIVDDNILVRLSHPGYSGKHWDSGVIGSDYIDLLSKYRFMVCTTCNEKYELLKYIECAEAGCIPIGEVPVGVCSEEMSKLIISIPDEALVSTYEFNDWLLSLDCNGIENKYRELIRSTHDNSKIVNKLLNSINGFL